MQNTSEYICAYCGESNLTFVDLSAGSQQLIYADLPLSPLIIAAPIK
ncbi:MAG TPA: hypothetical protein DEV81_21210 [Cyanobacteria bacterium UBA11049]|nr:hypothetical protein [Cyanobacteria bacterium UBA11049]